MPRITLLFACLLALVLTCPLFAQPLATELRGIWLTTIDSDLLFNPRRLQQGIDRLAKLNFNTLFPSDSMAKYTGRRLDPRLQGRDVLAETIQLGHKHKLAVVPWLEYGLLIPANTPTGSPSVKTAVER